MNIIKKIKRTIYSLNQILYKFDRMQCLLGQIASKGIRFSNSKNIQDYEFRVYSQWGEDGIIQFLINKIPIENKIFVEFGVQNYVESATRWLLVNNNWEGLVIDSSDDNIQFIKNDPIYWRHNLKAVCAFIERDNINDILKNNGITGDIGILVIDVDGNDYWIWEAIDCVKPRVIVCEYNSLFGYHRKVTIPYSKSFIRKKAHFSNLYYGASIAALDYLAKKKGYSLIGSNSAGNNAFFVRNDLIDDLKIYSPEDAYVKAQFRESRDIHGKLTFLNFAERLKLIGEMPLYDLDSEQLIKIKNIKL